MSTAKEKYFGVETELYLPMSERSRFDIGGHWTGGRHIPNAPRGWNMEEDGSLRPSTPNGYFPVEVLSPKLKGMNGLVELTYMLDELTRLGGVTNRSCGTHIHVDARDMDRSTLMNVVRLFKRCERSFYALNGDTAHERQRNTFCSPVNMNDLHDRYHSLNVSNWLSNSDRKKTVEFRLFSSSLDAQRVVGYVYLCVGLVILAENVHFDEGITSDISIHDLCQIFKDRETFRIVPELPVIDVLTTAFRNVKRSTLR